MFCGGTKLAFSWRAGTFGKTRSEKKGGNCKGSGTYSNLLVNRSIFVTCRSIFVECRSIFAHCHVILVLMNHELSSLTGARGKTATNGQIRRGDENCGVFSCMWLKNEWMVGWLGLKNWALNSFIVYSYLYITIVYKETLY